MSPRARGERGGASPPSRLRTRRRRPRPDARCRRAVRRRSRRCPRHTDAPASGRAAWAGCGLQGGMRWCAATGDAPLPGCYWRACAELRTATRAHSAVPPSPPPNARIPGHVLRSEWREEVGGAGRGGRGGWGQGHQGEERAEAWGELPRMWLEEALLCEPQGRARRGGKG